MSVGITDAESGSLKVYLESSFISYLTGRPTSDAVVAANQAYTRQWWRDERLKCSAFASRFVVDESNDGSSDSIAKRREILQSIPIVEFDETAVANLAEQLLSGHAIPKNETTDALHIATASVLGADVLLTWNCRHMANPHTLPLTRRIVTAAGFTCPAIMTPKTFLDNLNMEAKDE